MACSPQRMAAHAQGCTVCDACKAMNSPHDSAFRGNQSDGMRMCNRCYCRPSSRVYGRTGSSCSGRGTARTSRAPLSPGPSAATFGTSVPCRRKVYDEDGRLRECDCEGSAGKWHIARCHEDMFALQVLTQRTPPGRRRGPAWRVRSACIRLGRRR